MKVKTLKPKLLKYVADHNLKRKLVKQVLLLETNSKHPSLNTEKLEPKEFGFYSFRIDRKYRAIFILSNPNLAEIVDINDHYQ